LNLCRATRAPPPHECLSGFHAFCDQAIPPFATRRLPPVQCYYQAPQMILPEIVCAGYGAKAFKIILASPGLCARKASRS